MLASTIAITVVIAGAVFGWRMLQGDDDGPSSERGEWDEVALVDRSTGAITRLDSDGQLIATAVGLGRVADVHVFGDRMALVGPDQIVLTAPDADPVTIPIERDSTVLPIRTADGLHLAIGRPSGGNVLIVDALAGTVIDVGAMAEQPSPRLFVETMRWSSDGGAFAVADAANFQTIVVRPDGEAAIFLPDQPVAVADQLVATSQTVGRQADIALLDFQRRNQAFVPAQIPAGGVMNDERLVMVAVDGGIYRISKGAEEADRLGAITVPAGAQVTAVHPTADGERLVVAGPVFEAVIDLDGTTIFTTSFATGVDIPAPDPSWSCLPVGGDDNAHSLIELADGEQLADLTGAVVLGTSSDGCAVLVERTGAFELIEADGTALLGSGRSAVVAPDGRTVVRTGTDGRIEMLRLDGSLELQDAIDITTHGSFNTTVVFLDR